MLVKTNRKTKRIFLKALMSCKIVRKSEAKIKVKAGSYKRKLCALAPL
jgi:ribosomal protein L28